MSVAEVVSLKTSLAGILTFLVLLLHWLIETIPSPHVEQFLPP